MFKTIIAVISVLLMTLTLNGSVVASSYWYPERLSKLPAFVAPELANSKSYKVGVTTMSITNPEQLDINNPTETADRTLKLEIWYPISDSQYGKKAVYRNETRLENNFAILGDAYRNRYPLNSGQFPLVVMSHGYVGYRTMMYYLGEHLAANGYVVVSIDHPQSTNEAVDFVNAPGAGFPSTLFNRSRDQQFVLNYFAEQSTFLSGIVDTDNASIIGYSMGGYGALNSVGACYNFTAGTLQLLGYPEEQATLLAPLFSSCAGGKADASAVDPRWKGIIALAPWGGELGVFNVDDLSKVKVPSLFIAGDQDQIAGYEFGIKRLYDTMAANQKYMLVYENARHNVSQHAAPLVARQTVEEYGHYNDEAWNNEVINAVNEHFALAFLNCHVKAIDTACEYLNLRRNSNASRDATGQLVSPWKGFSAQYSTGMQWHTPNN